MTTNTQRAADLFQLELILRCVEHQLEQRFGVVSAVLYHLITELTTSLVAVCSYSKHQPPLTSRHHINDLSTETI